MSWWAWCACLTPNLSVMTAGKRSRTLAEQLCQQRMAGILLILRKLFLTTLHYHILQIKPTLCLPILPCFYPTMSVLLLTGVWYFWQSHIWNWWVSLLISLCALWEKLVWIFFFLKKESLSVFQSAPSTRNTILHDLMLRGFSVLKLDWLHVLGKKNSQNRLRIY